MGKRNSSRDRRSGQYAEVQDRPCVCGHGNHTEGGGCIGHEFGECEAACPCEKYRKAKGV